MGAIITVSAVHSMLNPPAHSKIFSHLHPDLWWGIIMVVFGLFFAIFNRRNIAR